MCGPDFACILLAGTLTRVTHPWRHAGLDSTTAMHCMEILRELAAGGRSIITTIHQPSSRLYQSLDKLLLLSQVRSSAEAALSNMRCLCHPNMARWSSRQSDPTNPTTWSV